MPPPETVSTQYAGFISRSTAFVIDLLLITLVTFLATTVISVIAQFFDLGLTQITLDDQTTLTPLQALVTLAAGLLQMFLGLVYFLFFWVLVGFTPGMGLLGIRVIRCDQQRLGLGRAIVRYIGYWVALIFLGVPIAVAMGLTAVGTFVFLELYSSLNRIFVPCVHDIL